METSCSRNGSVTLFMLSVVFVFVVFGLGLLRVTNLWTERTREQIVLDRCVGRWALKAKNKMQNIDALNIKMFEVRSLMAKTPHPAVSAKLKIVLGSLFLAQEALIKHWNLQLIQWGLPNACGNLSSSSTSLPALPYLRPPPDFWGPKPLKTVNESISFKRKTPHRKSHAKLNKGEKDWKARWSHYEEQIYSKSFGSITH